MAVNLTVGDQVLVTLNMTACGQRCQVTQRYRCSAVTGTILLSAGMTALITSLRAAGGWINKLKSAMATNLSLDTAWAQVVKPTRFRKTVVSINEDGLFDSPMLTANVSAAITKVGQQATRRTGISTMHVPIPEEPGVFEGGLLTPAYKALLDDVADALANNIITTGVVATFIPQTNDAGNPVVSDIYSTEVQPTVRVMRRRTVGLGI